MEIQTELIDFSECEVLPNTYDGAAFKFPIMFEGERYLLKFGERIDPSPKDPGRASYFNTPLTEHLGSRSFELLGLDAQNTILGTYQGRRAVACKDFIYELGRDRYELVEFKKQERSVVGDSGKLSKTPALENLLAAFDGKHSLAPIRDIAEQTYWKMFIGDALFGNFDRHAGNWGYILDCQEQRFVGCAPIFDCGGCFTPKLSDEMMQTILQTPGLMEKRILSFPSANLLVDGKRVKYHEFLLSPEGARCRSILANMKDHIDLRSIKELFQKSCGMSDIQRDFYSSLVDARYEHILQPAIDLAIEEQHEKNTEHRLSFSERCSISKQAAESQPAYPTSRLKPLDKSR